MTRNSRFAMRVRDEIHERHGNCCAMCKRTKLEVKLHIDCIVPRGNKHHRKLGWDQRMRFYLQQEKDGNIQLLCEQCNSIKGTVEDRAYDRQQRQAGDDDYEVSSTVPDTMTEEVPF